MANAAARVSDRNNMIMIGKYLISENKDEVKRDPQRRQQCSWIGWVGLGLCFISSSSSSF